LRGSWRGNSKPRVFGWFEEKLDSGPQDWKEYTAALLIFCTALFAFGFLVLVLQPWMPMNPDGKWMLAPSTIFHSAISFMTNTNLQHYSGDQHLSNFSQIFFILTNMFLSAAVGFCALTAIIRAFRGEKLVGNFFVDMWRVVVYMFVPASFIIGVIFLQQGAPMTFDTFARVSTLESPSTQQTIVVGPVARWNDQDARDQRRRFLRDELGASVRKPNRISNFVNTMR